MPDLLVGFMNKNYLIEVKNEKQSPSQRKLTPDQVKWHNAWCGTVHVVIKKEDALEVIGV